MSTTDVSELKEIMQTIRQEQRDMMQLLQGNKINPSDRGLLGRVEDTEDDIRLLKSQRDRVVYIAIGVCGVIGTVWTVAKVFLK